MALGSVLKPLHWELSFLVKTNKANGHYARAIKDARHTEQWVGSDVWHDMVLKAIQGLRYIHDQKDNPGFVSNVEHSLSNHFPSVIIYLNCNAGKCGSWEQMDKEHVGAVGA